LYDDLPPDQPGVAVDHQYLGDVEVPAGEFHSCYSLFTYGGPGHTQYVYCPQVGFIQFEDLYPYPDVYWSMTLTRFEP
jgi:hypothetical protein